MKQLQQPKQQQQHKQQEHVEIVTVFPVSKVLDGHGPELVNDTGSLVKNYKIIKIIF